MAGRFRLERRLGAGGFAAVWLAVDLRGDGGRVALKILHPHHRADAAVVDRFIREARLLEHLDHPHIARARGFHLDADRALIVMEHVEGRSLRALLDERATRADLPTLAQIAAVVRPLLDALAHAHAAGVVHRDLKPANVVVAPTGPKLVDFGIAKEAHPSPDATATGGQILGSITYLTPEQLAFGPVDARTDLFAIGALLFELSTLRRMWAVDTENQPLTLTPAPLVLIGRNDPRAIARRIATGPRPRVTRYRPDLPLGLDLVVERACAVDPADRYADAASMARALDVLVEAEEEDLRATDVVGRRGPPPPPVTTAARARTVLGSFAETALEPEPPIDRTRPMVVRAPPPLRPARPPSIEPSPSAPPPPSLSRATTTTTAIVLALIAAHLALWLWADRDVRVLLPSLAAGALGLVLVGLLDLRGAARARTLAIALHADRRVRWSTPASVREGYQLRSLSSALVVTLPLQPAWRRAHGPLPVRVSWALPRTSHLRGSVPCVLLIAQLVARRIEHLPAAEAEVLVDAQRILAARAVRSATIEHGMIAVMLEWSGEPAAELVEAARAAQVIFAALA